MTDGSYDRNRAPNISGAGWVICCLSTKKIFRASFFEVSPDASSYRGELLGLLALHVFISAIVAFYELDEVHAKVCCDNIAALRQSSRRRSRVKTGSSQADILRVLRTIKSNHKLQLTYEHVDSHQDRKKLWWQLTLEEQLNCVCDYLAKSAVSRSMMNSLPARGQQLLPMETAAVFVDGVKLTTDVAKEVRFCLGEQEARAFYTAPKKKAWWWFGLVS